VKFKSKNFICKNCGGTLRYDATTHELKCDFCSSLEHIEKSNEEIEEYDFKEGLTKFRKGKRVDNKEITCEKCGATIKLEAYSISSNCPYCKTPIITDFTKAITPKSLIPFVITQKDAQKRFKKWIGSLWFAPTKLKDFVDGNKKLTGYYLPYWTFDSQTETRYSGQRGDIYFVTVRRRVEVNGREEIIEEEEARVRWTPVRGDVSHSFDDITVGASKTIPHSLLDALSPWNTRVLVPFNQKYLSGFKSEEYTIDLNDGFIYAKKQMEQIITQDIRADIGGDHQRIEYMKTEYNDTTYKDTLFPIWSAEFKWKDKVYDYLINGQSGKVVGERPYSIIKITIAIISLITVIGVAYYFGKR
jgi:predicted Zn-ribbon and HTH transcriptional regulator